MASDVTQDEDAEVAQEAPIRPTIETDIDNDEAEQHKSPKSAESATSPSSKVKGWIKNRFSRGKSVSEKDGKRKSFLGGVALRGSGNDSAASLENRPTSMRDVAMAGKTGDDESSKDLYKDSRGVSPVSTDSDEVDEAGPSRRSLTMVPPKPLEDPVVRTSSSPTRDSRFREMMDR